MNKWKIFLLVVIAGLAGLFFALDLQAYLNLDYFQSRRQELLDFAGANKALAGAVYFVLYVAVTALSLPVATVITLIGGAVFGFAWALLLVSFASTMGATLAFLVARTILRDWVQGRFGDSLKAINRGVEKDGAFYLFTLRLVPAFPFFLINVAMALTPISTLTFYLVSQAGMLFGTALYVNVGVQLGQATSVPAVFSLNIVLSLIAVAVFPWVAKGAVAAWKRNRVLRPFPRPRRFDANLVVIGAGSAGLVTSYIAALVKAKVVLIEKHRMGGDCLNTGCVPSKALIRSASAAHLIRRAGDFGLVQATAKVDFPKVMARVKNVIAAVEPHDSVERYTGLGVECIQGEAKITSPYTVAVNGREIATRAIVLATGARPAVPPIPGLSETGYLTSDTVWDLEELPGRLLVVGAGPIGCELAQAFARLGSQVTLVDFAPRVLPLEDEDVAAAVARRFEADGLRVFTGFNVERFERLSGSNRVVGRHGDGNREIEFDQVLLAVGRRANVQGFGLEELGVPLTEKGTVEVNEFLQARVPNIYACGDVTGPYQFTHMAGFQAWYASVNALFGMFRKFAVNYSVVPWATFVDPEVARVGLNESEARAKGVAFEVTRFGIDDLDRAIADGENTGFIKVLTVPGRDKILGATIAGYHAAELITEFVTAMTHGLGLKKIMSTIHIYPTLSESNKYAASEWRKNHAPEWIYPWLQRFHRWRRR